MITNPDKYAPEFIKAGADWVSVHPDTCANPNATLNKLRELGAKASIAVNPDVPLSKVEGCFPDIDMILMMTVFPGFGGQAFIPDVLPKIEEVRRAIDRETPDPRRGRRRRRRQYRPVVKAGASDRLGIRYLQDVELCRHYPADA
jgi:ribulose-phosphate 3-epimerase